MVEVSVVVPIYNVEKYLDRCLESLVNQTFQAIEIICVNDGSPDQSQKIVDDYQAKYPHLIKSLIKENGGLGDARNYGLAHATGKYICFVDSDDWVELEMIEEMYQNAIENESDIVCCGLRRIDEHGNVLSREQLDFKKEYDPKEALVTLAPAAWNKLYRKGLFDETGIKYPVGLWYEDLPTTSMLIMNSKKITTVNEIFVNYLQREGSIIYSYDERSRDIFTVLDQIRHYNEEAFNGQYQKEVEYLYSIHIVFAHLFRSSILTFSKLNEEVKYSLGYINQCFPQWKSNSYLKWSNGLKMSVVNKIGILGGLTFVRLHLYVWFLLIYKLVNKVVPIQNKW